MHSTRRIWTCHRNGVYAQTNEEVELLSLEIEDAGNFLCNYEHELLEIIMEDDPGAEECREILAECWKTIELGRLAGKDGYVMQLECNELTWGAQEFIKSHLKLEAGEYE